MTLTYDNLLMTKAQYADHAGVKPRTVQRWLDEGELPGAVRNESGWWMIPAGAIRVPRTADIVPITRPMTPTYDIEPMSHPARVKSFYTLQEAADELGISQHAIATHRDYFGVVPFGRNGSLLVPASTIKRIQG